VARSRAAQVADLAEAWTGIDRHAAWSIAFIAGVSASTATALHTFAASGADASGYLGQTSLFESGRLLYPDTLAQSAAWLLDPWSTVPLGWRPAVQAGFQVPTYAPGLPLLTWVPHALAGSPGASLVVSIAAAVTVAATGAIARSLAGGAAGVLAAALIAVSPVFVSLSFQPMSDVPVTAAWLLCWWCVLRNRPVASGVAAAMALLIRPNLAPVALVPAAVWWRLGSAAPGSQNPARPDSSGAAEPVFHAPAGADFHGPTNAGLHGPARAGLYMVPVVVAGLAIALLNWYWYGSPLTSGYGAATEIYALSNIAPNLRVYGAWTIETQPVLLLALLAALPRLHGSDRFTVSLLAFGAVVVACYLAYAVFEHWTYLRFLLPALAVAAALAGALGARAAAGLPAWLRAPAWFVLLLMVLAQGLLSARSHEVTVVTAHHRRMMLAGPYLASALAPRSVVIAGEQSGAIRYYTSASILRWEVLTPEDLVAALAALEADGRDVWWALDRFEEPLVRAKFASIGAASLDWPPALDAGPLTTTRAWRVRDRARFLRGATVTTDRLR
jgi:hypothetical protein